MAKDKNTFWLVAILVLLIIVAVAWNQKPYKPTPLIMHLKNKLALIHPKFRYLDIREGSSSYTENKKTIYICTRDPKTNMVYDDNILLYVCIHECAHVLVPEYDEHGPKFKAMMDHLLKKAIAAGIYDPSIPIPPTYCGL